MSDKPIARRYTRTAAPGVTERHTESCTRSKGGRRCTCSPMFRAVVSIGGRGARQRFSRTFSSLGDAAVWVEDVKRSGRSGEAPADDLPVCAAVPTIREAADTFTTRMEVGDVLARGGKPYSAVTVDNYAGALSRDVLPFMVERYGVPLGDLRADVVDTRMIEAMAESIAAAGRRQAEARARKARKAGRNVRTSTGTGGARIAVAALRQLLTDLYKRGVIDRVPEAPVTMPAPPKGRDRRLDMAAADALVVAAFADDQRLGRSIMGPYVLLSSRIGARLGELCGLTWGVGGLDLSGDVPTVTIARATTKTDAGARTVALLSGTVRAMKAHRLATGRPTDGTPVFQHPARKGEPVTRDLLRSAFARIGEAAEVENPGTHLFRHSVASWAVESGMDHVQVAARLGHRDAAFTVRTYAHPDRDRIARQPLDLGWSSAAGDG